MRSGIMNSHDREFAWRVFAGEYNNATLEIPPKEERSPGYLVTPLGAKINRVFFVGVLTELEKLERNGNVTYRARVSDRTGVFHIYAGQFDPSVTKILSQLEPPAYVAVVGKARRFSPKDGVFYLSVRPESITLVDKSVRDYWLLDTCKSMKSRLEAVVEAQQLAEPEPENLEKIGYDPQLARGVVEALRHYEKINIEPYRNMLIDVLKFLLVDNGVGFVDVENPSADENPEYAVEFQNGNEFESDMDSDEEKPDHSEEEEKLLKIISSFGVEDDYDGVPWHDLVAKADSEGFSKIVLEEVINSLLEKGKVYEPMLGRIKQM
jgi:RPA family protein